MCLAIYKPKNATLSKEHLKNGFNANNDGAGFVISDGKTLKTFKGFFDFATFYANFKPYNRAGVSALVHFRFATHGAINTDNCHPFAISDELSAIHNGVLAWRSTDKESDTACFIADTMRPLASAGIELFKHPAYRLTIEKAIGDHNKIALLSACGQIVIYNEHKSGAHWHAGAWFSNSGYKTYDYYPYADDATPYKSWADRRHAGAWSIESDNDVDYNLDHARVCEVCAIDLDAGAFDLSDVNKPTKNGNFCHFCHCQLEDETEPQPII